MMPSLFSRLAVVLELSFAAAVLAAWLAPERFDGRTVHFFVEIMVFEYMYMFLLAWIGAFLPAERWQWDGMSPVERHVLRGAVYAVRMFLIALLGIITCIPSFVFQDWTYSVLALNLVIAQGLSCLAAGNGVEAATVAHGRGAAGVFLTLALIPTVFLLPIPEFGLNVDYDLYRYLQPGEMKFEILEKILGEDEQPIRPHYFMALGFLYFSIIPILQLRIEKRRSMRLKALPASE